MRRFDLIFLVHKHASQLLKFAVVGGIGSVIDLSSLAFFVEYLGVEKRIAVIFSTICAVIVVFILNKKFTFKNKEKKVGTQAMKFALVYGAAAISNISISAVLITIGVQYLLAKMAAIGIGAAWNYSMSHGFVFKKSDPVTEEVVVV